MSSLQYPALVLNADYTPINIHPLSTWGFERTLRNFLKDRITPLEFYDTTLRSPSFEYKPPSVIALKEYVKKPHRIAFSRYNIFLRDDFTCQYCMKKFTSNELTFDHVIPRSEGGGTSYENIVACCVSCNTRKGSNTFMKPVRRPVIPTERQLMKSKNSQPNNLAKTKLHKSWMDYLYWSGVLEQK